MNTTSLLLGKKLVALRKRKKLSLSETARRARMSPSNLQKIEKGEVDCRVSMLLKILTALNTNLEAFQKVKT